MRPLASAYLYIFAISIAVERVYMEFHNERFY
jgi:hypothetical protein